jgi:hypothetical protein
MGGRSHAAAVVAVAFWLCSVVLALAQSTGKTLLFSGTDLWGHGSFLYGGVLWSPGSLDREGFTLKAVLSGGTYNYLSGAFGKVQGRELVAQIMPGWRFKYNAVELKAFLGLDAQNHRLYPNDPDSKMRGTDIGLRVAFDFWAEPTADTMIAFDGSASTIAGSYAVRAAGGWRLFKRFYFGPEVQAFASDGYRQQRFGAHITALKIGGLEYSAATGYATDSDHRDSAYVHFGFSRRY